ncbi:MAG: hypothetical protein IPK63_13495 [Candidatus Competibacteraceae bacterium]|nr:hypothetical protein [Candidatus Competibacteraceae bacterium]
MFLKTLTKISTLALIAGLTVGCASTSDVQKAQNDASEAKAMSRQALDAANSANACCQDNSEKLNRVFKKSMYK